MIGSFLTRLTGRTPETRAVPTSGHAAAWTHGHVAGWPTADRAGHGAENLAGVMACVGAIASTSASFPAYVYRVTKRGREELTDHPVARLARRPNEWQTWPDFVEWWLAQTLLHGNGIAEIQHDGAGRPVALLPIPWGNVSPVMLAEGRLALDVVAYQAPWGHAAQRRRLLPGEFVHLKDRSDDGMIGRSRLSRAHAVIGTAMALQEYNGAMWHNQVTPAGAIKIPGKLAQEGLERLRLSLDQRHAGPSNARKALILTDGAEWQSLSVSPEDAEVLASRRFTVEELCRLFQVPPPIVQDLSHGTFTNSREAGRWFAQFTLSPWCRKIEAEFSRSVFSDPALSLELDMSALMRGDAETRWQSHKIAVDAGILTQDEVREIEGFNPRGEATVV